MSSEDPSSKNWVPTKKELEDKWERLSGKLERFRRELVISASVTEKFELEYRIRDTEAELKEIETRLEQIEAMGALSLFQEFKHLRETHQEQENKVLDGLLATLNYVESVKSDLEESTRKINVYRQQEIEYQTKLNELNQQIDVLKKAKSEFFPIFGAPKASLKKNWAEVFVIMPFLGNLKPVYTDHIRKVTDELRLSCERGDDFFSTHTIIDEIWAATYFSKLCIADCTGRNPNVFYELGIAHAIGKQVVLLAQSIDDIPFDIRHLRFIIYEYTPRGMKEFETTLRNTIQTSLSLNSEDS